MNKRTEFLNSCVVVDVETNSQDNKVAEVIEEGIALYGDDGNIQQLAQLFKASEVIPPEISAITNITQKMVKDCPVFSKDLSLFQQVLDYKYAPVCCVAHNVVYDRTVLERYGIKSDHWICTFRLAKKLFGLDESVKQFNLPYLRYRFDLMDPADHVVNAHRADDDAHVTLLLLTYMVGVMEGLGMLNPELDYTPQIVAILAEPVMLRSMPFGKHKGVPLEKVPVDYWWWAINNMDCFKEESDNYDADLSASVQQVLNKLVS